MVPALNTLAFIPRTRAYASVTDAITNQDYLALSTISPNLGAGLQGTNLAISWYGISGVSYQALYSTNLTDWVSYSVLVIGTNGPAGLLVPMDADLVKFFRVRANN